VEGLTKSVGYVSNHSRSEGDKQGLDFRRVADTVPGCILVADADGKASTQASFNMVELLGEVIGLLKEDASRRSTPIEYEFEEPVLEVLVDRYQIQQIIINLVTNAIDAMQDVDRQPLLRIRIRNAEGGRVLTEFIDNGRGLPDDGADRIFDAFVSTKDNGMGIGLAISRSIVEAHDGEIWAADNSGGGATFSLMLKGSGASQE
jgi:signal transduction histidine kinase